MVKVIDAQAVILASIKSLSTQVVKLNECLRRVLSEDIIANLDIPQFDNSAMDGYALRSSDTKGASHDNPKILTVIDDIKAGDLSKKNLKPNQAVRIMTGAPIPKGADSVIMVENTEKSGDVKVKVFAYIEEGGNIRKAGEDITKGECVLKKGTLLKASHIGLLASLGRAKVRVARQPKVAILATGDELVDVGKKLTPGKIHSSNSYSLLAQVLECGGIPVNLGIAKDNPKELERKIRQGLDCDLMITSGGVSVGDYDLVKDILAKMGTEIKFWKVAMRPGKPLAFGMIKGKPVFGLPGNPVSSMVVFEIFVRPAILKMLGQLEDERKEVEAELEEEISKKNGLKYFLRARTRWEGGKYLTRTTGPQGSGILKSMGLADSLIILDEEKAKIEKGSKVNVWLLN